MMMSLLKKKSGRVQVTGDTKIQPSMMNSFLERALLNGIEEDAQRTLNMSAKAVHSEMDLGMDSGDEGAEEIVKSTILQKWIMTQDEALMHVKPCSDIARKKFEILRQLRVEDVLMVDLKILLYIASADNDVRLKPFPSHMVDESPEGKQALIWLNSRIPPVRVLQESLKWRCYEKVDENVVDVVHWLIVQLRQPKLVNLPRENFDSVFQRVEYATNVQNPSYIAKIMVNNLCSNHLQWQATRGKQPTKYAFHATRPEHVHSLVHLGLYPFHKVSGPFGKGIYLTSDLKTCLETSPPTWVWGKSAVGTQLQTVTVVEFIATHPKIVRYRDGKSYPTGKPYNYYVPHNNLMQARYLLIFVINSYRMENKALEMISKRKFREEFLHLGLLIGGYIVLYCAAMKYLNGSDSSNVWHIFLEKMKSNRILSPITLFMQPIKDIL